MSATGPRAGWGETRQRILALVRDRQPVRTHRLIELTGMAPSTVKEHLLNLERAGAVALDGRTHNAIWRLR